MYKTEIVLLDKTKGDYTMEQKQEFVITKTGILKEYNGTEEVVIIPKGFNC